MKKNAMKSLKFTSWCWLSIAIGICIYFFKAAIQSSSFSLSLVGIGFLLQGVVWFRYPTPFTIPLNALFRDEKTDMDRKSATIGFIGMVLATLGALSYWIIRYF